MAGITIMLILMVIFYFFPADSVFKTAWVVKAKLRAILIVIWTVFLLVVGRPRQEQDIKTRHHWATWWLVALLASMAGVWVGLLQMSNPTITFYLVMLCIIAIFSILPPGKGALALGLGLAFMVYFVSLFQEDHNLMALNILNGIILTLFAYIVILLNYIRSVRNFKDRILIERQAAELEALSLSDELTGLANRRRMDMKLEEEWTRGCRNGQPLSLVMMDIDDFKLFNDTYGHAAGDDCLNMVAKAIDKCLNRGGDMAARFGGEEFLVILPDTEAEGAVSTGQNILQAVWNLEIPHAQSEHGRVTVSIGMATMICNSSREARNLLEEADKALYQAKAKGRNQIYRASERLCPDCTDLKQCSDT